MSSLFHTMRDAVLDAIRALQQEGTLPPVPDSLYESIVTEPPKHPEHGHMACNAAMLLAKPCKMPPLAIAQLLVPRLEAHPMVVSIRVDGPGFINMRLTAHSLEALLHRIIAVHSQYDRLTLGQGKRLHVEYGSPNPTGPMHVGHVRGAVFGDVLAKIFEQCGYHVTRETYSNDAGSQIDRVVDSALLRYRQAVLGVEPSIPAGLYPGEYLIPVGRMLAEHFKESLLELPEDTARARARGMVLEAMVRLIHDDLVALGIQHDVTTSEQSLHEAGYIDKAVTALTAQQVIEQGTLPAPKGVDSSDWIPRLLPIFKSTIYGDDTDRALQKQDGSWTYFAADLGYLLHKLERGYDALYLVLGADHAGYVSRMQAATAALSQQRVPLHVVLVQMVQFLQDGKPLQMSKRAGTYIAASDVIEIIGKDALRFMMLTRSHDSMFDFDLKLLQEQSEHNPVFYVQYAHARCHSVMRHIQQLHPEKTASADRIAAIDFSPVTQQDALVQLILLLAAWPRTLEQAALHHAPHRVVFYLQELASLYHGIWTRGRTEKGLRFITDVEAHNLACYGLLQATSRVIASGLRLCGVTPEEHM